MPARIRRVRRIHLVPRLVPRLLHSLSVASITSIRIASSTLPSPPPSRSRMTGGGFGGCTITLLRKTAVPALVAAIEKGVAVPHLSKYRY